MSAVNKNTMNAFVREAKKEDMKEVFQMIKDLAALPKLEDQVKIDYQILEEDGFKENPDFNCLVAESADGRIVGYCLYFPSYSTWIGKSIFLEDLYIDPDFRGQGLGTKMYNIVADVAKGIDGRVDFHVLSWNKKAVAMYNKLGAVDKTKEEYWTLFRLGEESLKKVVEKYNL